MKWEGGDADEIGKRYGLFEMRSASAQDSLDQASWKAQ
jgi:hypothetical protein